MHYTTEVILLMKLVNEQEEKIIENRIKDDNYEKTKLNLGKRVIFLNTLVRIFD